MSCANKLERIRKMAQSKLSEVVEITQHEMNTTKRNRCNLNLVHFFRIQSFFVEVHIVDG